MATTKRDMQCDKCFSIWPLSTDKTELVCPNCEVLITREFVSHLPALRTAIDNLVNPPRYLVLSYDYKGIEGESRIDTTKLISLTNQSPLLRSAFREALYRYLKSKTYESK